MPDTVPIKDKIVSCPEPGDAAVIDKITEGDVKAFAILIRKYNPYLYKTGRSYRFNHQDVEDLMQDTFIMAYKNLRNLENKHHFKTWLIRIMLNECYRKSHRTSFIKEVPGNTLSHEKIIPMFSQNSDTEKNVGNKELSRVIEKAVKKIPLAYRLVFSLRELNGLSVQETAGVLNITDTNVKVRLNRAKALLRKEVEKMYSAEEIFEFNLVYCDKMVAQVMQIISSPG